MGIAFAVVSGGLYYSFPELILSFYTSDAKMKEW
jgi:Na+-driven multidrug efflux pump